MGRRRRIERRIRRRTEKRIEKRIERKTEKKKRISLPKEIDGIDHGLVTVVVLDHVIAHATAEIATRSAILRVAEIERTVTAVEAEMIATAIGIETEIKTKTKKKRKTKTKRKTKRKTKIERKRIAAAKTAT